jgi:hypothetical protein
MKTKLLSLIAAAASIASLGALTFVNTSCETLKTTASDFWNNTGIQEQIKAAQEIALQFAIDWFNANKFFAKKSLKRTTSQFSAENAAISTIRSKYPDMPPNLVKDIVKAKFAEKN